LNCTEAQKTAAKQGAGSSDSPGSDGVDMRRHTAAWKAQAEDSPEHCSSEKIFQLEDTIKIR